MFDLEKTERFIILALTVTLLVFAGATAYKKSMPRRPLSVEKFAPRKTPPVGNIGRININKADAGQLAGLDGIGPAIAARIVEHRSSSGPFISPEDMKKVRGIGPALYDKIKDRIYTE